MKTTFFKSLTLALMLGFTAVFSSCDKNEEVLKVQNTEQKQVINPLTAAEGTATNELRSSSSLYARGEEASPSEGEKGTNFYFKFRGSPTNVFDQVTMQIRFYPPQGGSYIFDMDRVGEAYGEAIFEFERALSQTGTYRFEYGYSLRGSSFTPFNETFFVKVNNSFEDIYILPIDTIDDYPWKNRSRHNGDPNGFFYLNCTSWVAYKINQMWGSSNNFKNEMRNSFSNYQKLGNAKNWGTALSNLGYQADLNPQVGDIAWWIKTNSNNGEIFGHVAFVNEVLDNGNSVIITEYNYPSKDPAKDKSYKHNVRTLYRNGRIGQNFPTKFIHVQQKID